jgi:hypothetical protein
MKNEHHNPSPANHAPGAGSDKQHPDTPSDANDRFKKQEKEDVEKHPEDQNTG